MDVLFTKIKLKDGRVELFYLETAENGDQKEVKFVCYDEPLESFPDALQALVPHVAYIAEMTDEQVNERTTTVTGVALSHKEETGNMGAVITALRKLDTANAPMVINTPHLSAEPYSETNPLEPTLPIDTVEAIRRLCYEAERYMDGERAPSPEQTNLFQQAKLEGVAA